MPTCQFQMNGPDHRNIGYTLLCEQTEMGEVDLVVSIVQDGCKPWLRWSMIAINFFDISAHVIVTNVDPFRRSNSELSQTAKNVSEAINGYTFLWL